MGGAHERSIVAVSEPERTADGRHIVVDGRRWRATDPGVPETFRVELVRALMAARRDVGRLRGDDEAVAAARTRVQDAKVALGERGHPWWEDPHDEALRARLGATMRALLRARDPASSICPSDAARAIGGEGWRAVLDVARDVARTLAISGVVRITRGESDVDPTSEPATWGGPVRIRRADDFA